MRSDIRLQGTQGRAENVAERYGSESLDRMRRIYLGIEIVVTDSASPKTWQLPEYSDTMVLVSYASAGK